MPKRYWIAAIAFGLICLGAFIFASWESYRRYDLQHAKQREAISHHATSAVEEYFGCVIRNESAFGFLVCLNETANPDTETSYAKYDLEAQQDMAGYAYAALLVSIVGAVLSAVGLGALLYSLELNRRAVKAADDAVEATRKIGQAQARAYITIKDVEVVWHGARKVSFVIWCINTGSTPARFMEVGAICESVRTGTAAHGHVPDDLQYKMWSGIGAHDKLSMRITPKGYDEMVRSSFDDDDLVLSLRGRVRYQDMFDEIFESEFSFFAHRLLFEKRKMSAPPARLSVYKKAEDQNRKSKERSETEAAAVAALET